MKRFLLGLIVITFYLLHQDFWFWDKTNPLFFGFLPVGLFYHLCYTLAVSVLMWLLVKHAWPAQLEERAGERESARVGEGGTNILSHSPALPLSRSSTLKTQLEEPEDPHL
jgi:Protein of unknown function (DUF3311)